MTKKFKLRSIFDTFFNIQLPQFFHPSVSIPSNLPYDNRGVDAYQKSKMIFCLCRRVESCTTIIDTQVRFWLLLKYSTDEMKSFVLHFAPLNFLFRYEFIPFCLLLGNWFPNRVQNKLIETFSRELSNWNWVEMLRFDFLIYAFANSHSAHSGDGIFYANRLYDHSFLGFFVVFLRSW